MVQEPVPNTQCLCVLAAGTQRILSLCIFMFAFCADACDKSWVAYATPFKIDEAGQHTIANNVESTGWRFCLCEEWLGSGRLLQQVHSCAALASRQTVRFRRESQRWINEEHGGCDMIAHVDTSLVILSKITNRLFEIAQLVC